MKHTLKQSALSLALATSLLGSATWSSDSQACAAEPLISGICIMALAGSRTDLTGFHMADGSMQQINQYQALYSLIGVTYGGDARSTFGLPDLRGRVVVGVDPRYAIYLPGKSGGAASIQLTTSQLPTHVHALATPAAPGQPGNVVVNAGIGSLKVAMTGLTATTTIGSLAASTSLAGVTASASASGLTLNASSNATLVNSPSGALLGTTTLPAAKIYSTSGPVVAMQAGSITGTLPVTFAGASPSTTLSGAPATTISGSPSLTGAPSVSIGGATEMAGASAPVSTMPPYLALYYYIATAGIYPQFNN